MVIHRHLEDPLPDDPLFVSAKAGPLSKQHVRDIVSSTARGVDCRRHQRVALLLRRRNFNFSKRVLSVLQLLKYLMSVRHAPLVLRDSAVSCDNVHS